MNKQKNFLPSAICCALLAIFALGCATQMYRVKVGMTKEEVRKTIGKPRNVIEARKLTEGKVCDVWEYPGGRGGKKIWVYFVNERVDSWHRAGEMWTPRPVIPRSAK
ncbi:MAG: hypothetical protein ABIH01_01795 [Candidatus Omnitrophota bacterium]